MHLIDSCNVVFDQLRDVTRQIRQEDFVRPCPILGSSTLGQHLRHTLEFFICLQQGFEGGFVNYDERKHDKSMESSKDHALLTIEQIGNFVKLHADNKPLVLHVGYERNSDQSVSIDSNYHRELAYNIEHAVHHMALMKIGIRETAPYVNIPKEFGIAVSTLRYRELEFAAR